MSTTDPACLPPDLRRVLVFGVTGSGKTTLARRISEVTGLPWHSIDDEVGWLPGWVERPVEAQRRIAAGIVERPEWVLDTAYGKWRELALARADVVVALDYARWVSLSRLVRRTARRVLTREPVCNGNVESWRQLFSGDSIFVWHFRSFARKRDAIARMVGAPDGPPVVRLGSPRQTERWLARL